MSVKQRIKIVCDTKHSLPLDKLLPFQGELKSLTEKKYEKLKASLLRHGFSFPEFVWKSGKRSFILDGHQRVHALKRLRSEGIVLDGNVPVVYIQARNKKHAKELVLAATSQYGDMDEDSIYKFVKEADLNWPELKFSLDFAEINMDKLQKGWFDNDWTPGEREQSEEVPAKPKRPTTKVGDLWKLGDHLLLCGDCSAVKLPKKYDLLVTDPPYGVNYNAKNEHLNRYDEGNSNRVMKPLKGDVGTEEQVAKLWDSAFANVRLTASKTASWYSTAPPGPPGVPMALSFRKAGFPLRQKLAWVKNSMVFGRSDYHYQHEDIFYGWLTTHKFYGGRTEVSVWEIARPKKSPDHPTMKPVELYARAIRNSSKEGQWVADPFAGSGPIAIAAEKHGRKAVMIEIDRGYCDVIVERWQQFSGKKAKRRTG